MQQYVAYALMPHIYFIYMLFTKLNSGIPNIHTWRKPNQSIVIYVDAERIDTGDKYVEAEVKLATIDEVRLWYVLLHH